MNKRFLAIAIAASLAAPLTVMAEGAEIYGLAHVGVTQNSGDDSTDNVTVDSGNSRIGIKGSEDLGGGMKAVYKMEWQVDLPSGSVANMTARNQFVGLSGGMGTVLLGTHDTAVKMVQGKFDMFVDGIADMNRNGMIDGDLRSGNVIGYFSPKMGGMQMVAMLIPGEENGNVAANENTGIADGYSVSFVYEAGPVYVGLGVEGGDLINDQTRLVATYNMDALTVGFLYNVTDTQASTTDEDENGLGVNAAYAFGDNAVKFQYLDVSDNIGGATTGATRIDETTMTLGYDMNLSARTTAFALYRAFSEADITNIGVGIKHSF